MWKKYKMPEEYLKGRGDDPAFKRWANCVGGSSPHSLLLRGYANDAGVRANFGREGAAGGPEHFRNSFYKMLAPTDVSIVDVGDFEGTDSAAASHQLARENLPKENFSLVASIGGGHDWAALDFDNEKIKCSDIQIIHIDTHLDVRPFQVGKIHSGMPFRYLAQKGASIWCLGAQREYHTQEQWDYATSEFKGLVSLDDLERDFPKTLDRCYTNINPLKPLALSIDMDTFAQSISPGVSAPSPRGIAVKHVTQIIDAVAKNLSHIAFYELNPRLDRDDQSARLGAYLLSRCLLQKFGS